MSTAGRCEQRLLRSRAPSALLEQRSRVGSGLQAFLDVYTKLRDQLLNDPLLPDAPKAALEWVHEVSDRPAPAPGRRARMLTCVADCRCTITMCLAAS
jgi:hypothetical protein